MANPRFEIYPRQDGEWGWSLVAGNGETQASGEGYTSRQGATRGARTVARNAARAKVVLVDAAPSRRRRGR
jgi:uncharacterized protein YegP (UPF0339 family)